MVLTRKQVYHPKDKMTPSHNSYITYSSFLYSDTCIKVPEFVETH